MQVRGERNDQSPSSDRTSSDLAERMLLAVLDGQTYDKVASQHGVTRTSVERRIKAVAARAATIIGIEGVNEEGTAFVRRLRLRRDAVLAAVAALRDESHRVPVMPRQARILNEDEVSLGARLIRARSQHALEDVALYYLLFATGARPLEIARLQVLDYLDAGGTVRRTSELRSDVAITGRARPLFFRSARLDEAFEAYLGYRLEEKLALGVDGEYRGLDPNSRLFLSPTGQGFEVSRYGTGQQKRFRCRAIQETFRKLFRYAEFKGVTALTVRHTVADRLYARGADESQVGLLFGISERSAVRELFPRRIPSLDYLTDDLV